MARSAIRLGVLAAEFGCELVGDPQVKVSRVATLSSANAGELSFFANKAYRDQLRTTCAGVVLLRAVDADDCPVNALISVDPYLTFARIAGMLHAQPDLVAGTHSSAAVSLSAKIAANVQLSANVVVEDDAIIEADVFVGPGVVIGPRCRIGKASRLLANVTIVQDVELGERCIIHSGAVLGSDGFGNAPSDKGWVKVPQVGRLLIGNDVEIGANAAIDRGALDDTVIEDGVRLDNLVHIAHNVRIGEHTALAAQNGIAGSTTIGKRCMFGGQVGVDGHLNICDDVIVGGKSVLTKDIKEPGFYAGAFAAEKDKVWKRKVARFRRIENLVGRVQVLEKMAKDDDE